ncbi:unnamed protein product [Paramecium pentaurelia]|uniref:Uncharacterized protein n=1 Tax=Paramecium pentaurelia TaxID=43138 RepID=A0A8S1YJY2_9CILI|nr:unnamed protein product [Paramecium pentaurelia]
MEDNYNTNSSSQPNENPYPKFEPEKQNEQPQVEQPPQYAYTNDLNQPLIMGEDQHDSGDQIDKFLLYTRYLNIGAGMYVAIVGLYFLFTLKIWNSSNFLMSFYTMFLPLFYVFFGLLLLLAEYYKLEVNIYFRFLRSYLGRGIYNIFLGTQCVNIWARSSDFFSWILFTLGLIYLFLHIIRSKIHQDVKSKLLD